MLAYWQIGLMLTIVNDSHSVIDGQYSIAWFDVEHHPLFLQPKLLIGVECVEYSCIVFLLAESLLGWRLPGQLAVGVVLNHYVGSLIRHLQCQHTFALLGCYLSLAVGQKCKTALASLQIKYRLFLVYHYLFRVEQSLLQLFILLNMHLLGLHR